MPTYAEANIPSLLMQWLADMVHSPPLRIAWPNTKFTPPASGDWLEVAYLPNTNVNQFLASDDETLHRGLFQVTVVSELDKGLTAPLDLAGAVVERFASGTILYGDGFKIRVTDKPSVASPIKDAPNLRTPVTVRWQAFI